MSEAQEHSHFFEVKTEIFDGPIDLLLHLVKQNELPIEKLSLAHVTNQYLECIEAVKNFDLEIAGEYLVIAATLLSIKSSILLNEPVEMVIDEEGNLVDPHEELLRKLRAAEIYKDSAARLASRDLLGVDVFAAPPSLDNVEPGPVVYKQHDPMLLGKAFRKLLLKLKDSEPLYTVSFEKFSIVDRMMTILKTLESHEGPMSFEKLIPDVTSKVSLIASFVAMLELCKRHIISVKQDEVFDEILVVLATRNFDNLGLSSEFDAENAANINLTANG